MCNVRSFYYARGGSSQTPMTSIIGTKLPVFWNHPPQTHWTWPETWVALGWRTWSWSLCFWGLLDPLLLGPSGRSCCTKNTWWCILVAWKLLWRPRTPCITRGSITCILSIGMRPLVAFVARMMDTFWCQTRVSTLLGRTILQPVHCSFPRIPSFHLP